jgi:peroxiredoxin
MIRKILCAVILMLAVPSVHAQEVGKAAPDFALSDSNGKKHSLSDLKGKFVVLEWFNPGCPFVKKHYSSNNMQELQKKYTEKGVVWLTISSSAEGKQGHLTPELANQEIKEKKANMTALLLDHDGKVGQAYGAKTTPHMFVIDPKGTLIYGGAIDDNDSADPEVIKTSKNYVAAALDEAMSGKPVQVASTDSYGCSIKYAT